MMRLGIDQRQEVLPDVLAAGFLLPRLLLLIPDGDLVEGDDPPEIKIAQRNTALTHFA